MRLVFVIIFTFCAQSALLFAQDEAHLRKLDALAFYALEHSDTSVVSKAMNLLLASSKRKSPSFYTCNAHTILGIVNKDKGYYLTSLDHYLKALEVAEKLNDKGRTSACYNNIGTVYQLQDNYQKACEYFNKSLKIEETLNQPLQKSIRLYNLGDAYSKLNRFDLALSYFTNSLLIEKKLNNPEGIIYAELGIAEVYLKIGRLKDAEGLLTKTQGRLTKYQIEETILSELLNGRIAHKRGDFDRSLSAINKAETISKSHNFRIYLLDIYRLKIDIYKGLENWKMATKVYDDFLELKDELNTTKVKNQLEDMIFRNEIKKKELEIQLIQEEKDLAVKNEQLERNAANHRSKIVWFLIGTFILLFTLIFIGIRKLSN